MTQVLQPNDTGEIPADHTAIIPTSGGNGGNLYRTDQTSILSLPEREPAHLRLDEPPIFDLRPARPAHLGEVHRYLDDRPYPPVPPPVPPQPKPSLTDELLGNFTPITRPETPPVPSPPPAPPKPSWARSGSAGEWPIVKPLLGRGRRRRPVSALGWALVGSGLTVLLAMSAIGASALLGVQW